eukprot:763778-Hanusia_phi.AAC.25
MAEEGGGGRRRQKARGNQQAGRAGQDEEEDQRDDKSARSLLVDSQICIPQGQLRFSGVGLIVCNGRYR